MQLLGLKWAGERTTAREGVRRLAFLQRGDGGWAQNPYLATDAYATGLALYTIREMGEPVTGPVYRRGVEYLFADAANRRLMVCQEPRGEAPTVL